jgi:esterase/lipase
MDAQTGAVWMNDALKAYDRLTDAGCTRIFLLGLSMGGILCALRPSSGVATGWCS